jgi:hypothetical protein
MDLYRKIRNFAAKTLLIWGLVAVLGCGKNQEFNRGPPVFTVHCSKDFGYGYKSALILRIRNDLDNDFEFDYDLSVQRDGTSDEKHICRLGRYPEEFGVMDKNGDAKNDIVYLMNTGFDKNDDLYYEYELRMLPNKGENIFGEPEVLERYARKPLESIIKEAK